MNGGMFEVSPIARNRRAMSERADRPNASEVAPPQAETPSPDTAQPLGRTALAGEQAEVTPSLEDSVGATEPEQSQPLDT